jgi:hypothetical protein
MDGTLQPDYCGSAALSSANPLPCGPTRHSNLVAWEFAGPCLSPKFGRRWQSMISSPPRHFGKPRGPFARRCLWTRTFRCTEPDALEGFRTCCRTHRAMPSASRVRRLAQTPGEFLTQELTHSMVAPNVARESQTNADPNRCLPLSWTSPGPPPPGQSLPANFTNA